jgi:hypothetical protein
MLLVARKSLFTDRTRLAISVGGLAVPVFLIGILLSLLPRPERDSRRIRRGGAGRPVGGQRGAADFIYAASVLPKSAGAQLCSCQRSKRSAPSPCGRWKQPRRAPPA